MFATRNDRKRQRLELVASDGDSAGTSPSGASSKNTASFLPTEAQAAELSSPPLFDTLSKELLPNIFQFLDSVEDVFHLALCSKKLNEAVTPTIVVRAAVLGASQMHR
jgi:hypothetical protein